MYKARREAAPFRGFGGLNSVASNKEIITPRVHAVLGLQPRSHAVAPWLLRALSVAIACDGLLLCIDNHKYGATGWIILASVDPLVSLARVRGLVDADHWIEEGEGEENASERKAKIVLVVNRIRIGHAAGTPAACASRRAFDPAAAPVVGSTLTREGGAVGLSVPVEDNLAQCHCCRDID